MFQSVLYGILAFVALFVGLMLYGVMKEQRRGCRPVDREDCKRDKKPPSGKYYKRETRREKQIRKAQEKMLAEAKEEKPISHMEQEKAHHAQAYQPWTKEQDDSLRRMYEHGESMAAMQLVFQRGAGAIRSRLRKIGCSK